MKHLPIFFIAAFLLLPACQSSKSALNPTTVSVEGMRNATVIDDIMIGGQPSVEALKELSNQGYRSILTVRSPGEIEWDEQSEVEALGMSFHRIEMSNPVHEITDGQVEAFTELMSQREGPLVLHCGSGNRVSGLWASWLIEHEGVKPEEAIRLATEAGMRDSMKALVERRAGASEDRDQ